MEGHLSGVLSVSLAPNGLFAVSGGEDNMARVWGLTLGLTVAVYRVRIRIEFSLHALKPS